MHNTNESTDVRGPRAAFYFPASSRKCEFVSHIKTRRGDPSPRYFFSLCLASAVRATICHRRAQETQKLARRDLLSFCTFLYSLNFVLSSLLFFRRRFPPFVRTHFARTVNFQTRLKRRGAGERKEDARVYRRRKFITRRRLILSACPLVRLPVVSSLNLCCAPEDNIIVTRLALRYIMC